MTKTAQKILEECSFEMFSKVFVLPEGKPTYSNNPDVIWEGKSKIGIEITNFYITDGKNLQSTQRQSSLREKAVLGAHKKYQAEGGKRIELTFSFDETNSIQDVNQTINKITELAKKIEQQKTGDIQKSEFSKIPELFSVYIYNADCENIDWRISQAHSSEYMSAKRLQEIISDKDSKVQQYQKCDEYWLLVVVNYFDPAQDWEIRLEDIRSVVSTKFKKILLYRLPHEEVVVLEC
jgi:hypothetical protein